MKTVCLVIEYDGTDFAGWQIQPNGLAVQEVVEAALAKVLGEPVRIHSSGRTDAGVHARGMTAHFVTDRELPMSAFREGANRYLPATVAIREAAEMPNDFHARFSAAGKWYRYTLYPNPVRSPLQARTSWHIRGPLDEEAMRRAAGDFLGRHDFNAFRSAGCDAHTAVREIFSVELLREGDLLHIDFRGEGYLRNMVRIMVGTLVEIGLRRRPAEDVRLLLAGGDRKAAGITAPPQGLCLMRVWYR